MCSRVRRGARAHQVRDEGGEVRLTPTQTRFLGAGLNSRAQITTAAAAAAAITTTTSTRETCKHRINSGGGLRRSYKDASESRGCGVTVVSDLVESGADGSEDHAANTHGHHVTRSKELCMSKRERAGPALG